MKNIRLIFTSLALFSALLASSEADDRTALQSYTQLRNSGNILEAFHVLNELGKTGNKAARLEILRPEIYKLAYRKAVQYQNAVITPREKAVPLYTIALGAPNDRWKRAITSHIDFYAKGKDTFGNDYESKEMWEARMDAFRSSVRRIGRSGITKGNYASDTSELTAGQIFVLGMGALILWDINNAIQGKGPATPPVQAYTPPDSCKSTSFLRYSNSSWGTAMGMFGCPRY